MASSADIAYPEHGLVGLGKYLNAAMMQQPNFSGLNQSFANLGNMGPLVQGGQFIDPSQAQQYATPSYLGARGDIATQNIQNMFQLASLADQTGVARGNVAAMIPELQAQQIQLGSTGLFGGLL